MMNENTTGVLLGCNLTASLLCTAYTVVNTWSGVHDSQCLTKLRPRTDVDVVLGVLEGALEPTHPLHHL